LKVSATSASAGCPSGPAARISSPSGSPGLNDPLSGMRRTATGAATIVTSVLLASS
jgi:hypothetical protein